MAEKVVETMADSKVNGGELVARLDQAYEALKREIHNVIIGQDEVIDGVLSCVLSAGHCIVEGVPGLAKTLLVHSISEALDLKFNRIQFTPDLMPSDITGTEIIQMDPATQERRYQFVQGPIFANVILADEINRTPPKTQAALLQAMQEREVTSSGHTYRLDTPFFVLATQNPIEQEGTYALPEAARDRFMFMVYIDYPKAHEEHEIVKRTTMGHQRPVQRVLSKNDILQFQKLLRAMPISDTVIEYCVRLARATRPTDELATENVKKYLKFGAGPRAAQFMALGAKARALIQGRVNPSFEDVKAVCPSVLRHRLIPNFNAEADGVSVEQVIVNVLERTPLPK